MSVNWERIAQEQLRGVDPITAFNNEVKRQQEITHENQRILSAQPTIHSHDTDEEPDI